MSGRVWNVYTIYYLPTDLPQATYAVREFEIVARGELVAGRLVGTADTLTDARALVPVSADVCVIRDGTDPPGIVETWL